MQYSRNFSIDPNYCPNWRSLQAREYASAFLDANEETFVIPESEDDDDVVAYYAYLTTEETDSIPIKYAHSCNETDSIRGFGTAIKSMLLGGLTQDQIAEEMGTSQDNVEMYIKLFFDIEAYLGNKFILSSIISPFIKKQEIDEAKKQSGLWMSISLAFGWDKAKRILQRDISMPKKDVEFFLDQMRSAIDMQAAEFSLLARSGYAARPCDFERFIAKLSIEQAAGTTAASLEVAKSSEKFREALFSLAKSKEEEHNGETVEAVAKPSVTKKVTKKPITNKKTKVKK